MSTATARRSGRRRLAGAGLTVGIVLLTGCSSGGTRRPSVAPFVGHRWLITEVRHSEADLAIPATLGAWLEFGSDRKFGADDGVNSYGSSFEEVLGGFRLVGDVTATAVGVPGPGGAPASTLAVIAAIGSLVSKPRPVSADVVAGRLEIAVAGYRVSAIQTPS